jgi:peptide/nickel transport system substrate-binding protein
MLQKLIRIFKRGNPAGDKKALTLRQVFSVTKTRLFPTQRQWAQMPSLLSPNEKNIIAVAISAGSLALLSLVGGYIFTHRIEVPSAGGEYTEGIVGEPQFINPLYSSSNDVDRDISSLVFSGLLRWSPTKGYVPDLAESMVISEDAKTYTFKIRDNAKFHNGEEVRARDVLFTISAIQNPGYRSPLIDDFHNVKVVQDDDKTISFILKEPSAPFIKNLTVGILPSSIWAEILPQNAPLTALNLQPIGSGPYVFDEFAKDKRGSVRSYSLKHNDNHYSATPFVEKLTFKFYSDSVALIDALKNKNIEGASVVAFEDREAVADNANIKLVETMFPQEAILYFNQTINPSLSDVVIRNAIASAIDKQLIVDNALDGKAVVSHGPIPQGMIGATQQAISIFDPIAANATLDNAGYDRHINGMRKLKGQNDETGSEPKTLNFTLTAPDTKEMRDAAQIIQQNLFTIGIMVNPIFIAPDLLYSQAIESKNFEMLLTTVVFNGDPDLYPFWHSSQNKAGGLNLAGYEDKTVDSLITDARKESDATKREQKYLEISQRLAKDSPAVFLYQPFYGFAAGKKIHLNTPNSLLSPSDRFAEIESWYIKTKKKLK